MNLGALTWEISKSKGELGIGLQGLASLDFGVAVKKGVGGCTYALPSLQVR